MTQQTIQTEKPVSKFPRRDIHQQVTDTIIQQLEAGTVPWQQSWNGAESRILGLPKNLTTGNKYKGVNILLLWTSACKNHFLTDDWGSFKQWQSKNEAVQKGAKGSMIVYYDTFDKEVDGEIKKIPFLKTSVVFNRCQLASYDPAENKYLLNETSLVERIEAVDNFVKNTNAVIKHDGLRACYNRVEDAIHMPLPEAFNDTPACTATEGYYGTLLHELTHLTGHEKRLARNLGKQHGDKHYANEELVAELGAAFMCAEFGISVAEKGNPAAYIDYWLNQLKQNKHCLLTAASEASKAVDYLKVLQPEL